MGCKQSQERQPAAGGGATARNASRLGERGGGAMMLCHHCNDVFPKEELNDHTTRCPEREVTCWHSYCRKRIKQKTLKAHMEDCANHHKSHCPKCGDTILTFNMATHRDECKAVPCTHCDEVVIPRIMKYCPNQVFARVGTYRVGPFADAHLRERFLLGVTPMMMSPRNTGRNSLGGNGPPRPSRFDAPPMNMSFSPSDGNLGNGNSNPNRNYNVARIQHLWRWARARMVLDDLLFRMIYKEIDLKKETFSIFKFHDKIASGGEEQATRSRTAAPVQAIMAAAGDHYFPASNKMPLTEDIVMKVVADFRAGVALPYHAVWRILTDANALLRTHPNITRLAPPAGAKLRGGRWSQGGKTIIVGDLHGQLSDLLHIVNENGMPNERCVYIFNGDFVDRGHRGLEVVLVLFLLLICFPRVVSLNRGNHECDYMNEEYGFDVEVQTKYDRNIFKLVQRCFISLPLATAVGSKVFIVHGGIPRRGTVTFDDIEQIQRFRQIPMPEHEQPEEDEMFQDLMWSDPWEKPGWVESDRGVGVQFGPDISKAFCEANGIDIIVRSHEEYLKGYEEHHGGRVVTVFSASNYDGTDSNMGSFIVLVGEASEVSFHTFQVVDDDFMQNDESDSDDDGFGMATSVSHGTLTDFGSMRIAGTSTASMAMGKSGSSLGLRHASTTNLFHYNSNQSTTAAKFSHVCAGLVGGVNLLAVSARRSNLLQRVHRLRRSKDEVLRELRERIYSRRHRLLAYFTKVDRTQKGTVWKMEWAETMRNILNLDLPWFFLRPFLTDSEVGMHRINYMKFLCRFRSAMNDRWLGVWEEDVMAHIYSQLYHGRKRSPLVRQIEERDALSYNDYCSIFRTIDYTLTDSELFQMFCAIDEERRGVVSGKDVLERLKAAARHCQSLPDDEDEDDPSKRRVEWDLETMEQLQRTVVNLGHAQLRRNIFELPKEQFHLTQEIFLRGLKRLMKGLKKVTDLEECHGVQMWQFLQQHAANPESVDVDELFMAMVVRDRVVLAKQRQMYLHATELILRPTDSMMTRRLSMSFCGFGPQHNSVMSTSPPIAASPPVTASPLPHSTFTSAVAGMQTVDSCGSIDEQGRSISAETRQATTTSIGGT
jgi:diadenosine tetraphosphatase ApaH/serine/threonine PP2A family protein phosphatase